MNSNASTLASSRADYRAWAYLGLLSITAAYFLAWPIWRAQLGITVLSGLGSRRRWKFHAARAARHVARLGVGETQNGLK